MKMKCTLPDNEKDSLNCPTCDHNKEHDKNHNCEHACCFHRGSQCLEVKDEK